MMKKILQILNFKSLLVCVLSVVSTYFCIKFNIVADFPFTIITMAVVFPIVFSIGGAYKRRENALDDYGILKGHGKALYYASRDWLEDAEEKKINEKFRKIILEFFENCNKTFMDDRKNMRENEQAIYDSFSKMSEFIKTDLRGNGLPSGECSRCNQYLSKMMIAFENIKHIYQYRTPTTLRAFSDVFIVLLPFVYGPYFAYLALESSAGLTYVMPILFSIVLVALDSIQEHLENPFDRIGEDDIAINTEYFAKRLK